MHWFIKSSTVCLGIQNKICEVGFFHSSANSGLSRFSFCRQANTLPEQKPVFRLLRILKVILRVPRWQCIKPHGTYRTSFIQKISVSFCKHTWNHLTFLWDVRQALLQLISDRGSQGRKNVGGFSLGYMGQQQSSRESQLPAPATQPTWIGVLWLLTFEELDNPFPRGKSLATLQTGFWCLSLWLSLFSLILQWEVSCDGRRTYTPYSSGWNTMVRQAWMDQGVLQTPNKLWVANHDLTNRNEGAYLQGKSFVVPTYYLLFKSAKARRENIYTDCKGIYVCVGPTFDPMGLDYTTPFFLPLRTRIGSLIQFSTFLFPPTHTQR